MSARRSAELNLFRPLPWSSPVHRMWAGTKLVLLGGLAVALTLVPTWAAVGIVTAVVAAGLLAARVPPGAFPRLPGWFYGATAVGGVLALSSGGPPNIHLAGSSIGLGALSDWARFLAIGVVLVLAAALVAWTTEPGEVAPALARLGRPLRGLRVPVDELAATVALSVRCMPLLLDETRTLFAARRLRPRAARRGRRDVLREPHDLLAAVLIVSVRRARELAEAIESRGGIGPVSGPSKRPGWADLAAVVVVAAAVVAIVVL